MEGVGQEKEAELEEARVVGLEAATGKKMEGGDWAKGVEMVAYLEETRGEASEEGGRGSCKGGEMEGETAEEAEGEEAETAGEREGASGGEVARAGEREGARAEGARGGEVTTAGAMENLERAQEPR